MAGTLRQARAPASARPTGAPPAFSVPGVSGGGVTLSVLAIVLLSAVPAGLAASRPKEFRSEVALRVPAGMARQVEPPRAYVAGFVGGPVMRAQLEGLIHRGEWPASAPRVERITVRGGARADGGPVVISVPGRTPEEARRMADFTAGKLMDDTRRKFPARRRAEAEVARMLRRLRAPGLDGPAREALRRRVRFALVAAQVYIPIVPLAVSRPATLPKDGWLSRAVRPVTGRPLPAPEPVWSGVAGFLVATALIAASVLVRRRSG